ncbi:peptide chain release factor aRF-1 [Thermococcus sibiricus]|uniref:Peptide chain release factor subunit 1 n=1 Tax=Thermococcus sibiricus (strain DSM 12597 / MM 739) TaxID=604354 RepID=RF1_THESM|nr:peptide chain release factor aRF-1 [Thermococcus sibiricus]C5ZZZ5.1 RecName: Full=Peptide chain release factor subunit 1; AltName: Full=Translation termination factor aRF1 [Thermococcus sibiricus MM 739]ACS90976.1 Peptide chain release factor subunit 1 [Thermococcus sibiricus MM 739]
MSHKSAEMYELKKKVEELKKIRGRATELVSLYIPADYDLNKVMQQLREEYGTAQNIKSKTTRKNVLGALERAMQHLKLYRQTPETGLALFVGNVSEQEGVSDIRVFAIVPPEPLNVRLYRCDQTFVTEPLEEMLRVKDAYGLITVEKNEATIGILRGKKIEVIEDLTSNVPGKTRAGGQSARRYERIREQEAHEFMKRIGEHASSVFLPLLEKDELKGIIIGGPGPTKEEFVEGEYLHHELRKRILGVVDISYHGEYGLRELVEKASDILREHEAVKERKLVQQFFKHLVKDTGLITYGEKEVRKALELGAVDILLLSEGYDRVRVKALCNNCGWEELKTMTEAEFELYKKNLKACPKCNSQNISVEKWDVAEELIKIAEEGGAEVEIISLDTEEGQQFYKAFGGIAAILRYKLQ